MYSSEDFERFFIRYKKDTRHHVVSVQVVNRPEENNQESNLPQPQTVKYMMDSLRIMVYIRMSNGMNIQ